MSGFVACVLIFVAAGLLAVSAAMASRAAGREPSGWTSAGMAAMLGLALGFILRVVWITPLGFFPIGLAAMLIADWVRHQRGGEFGSFLVGAGAIWVWAEISAVMNDLSDAAVTTPGWTPIPLAVSLTALILGATLLTWNLGTQSADPPP